MAVDVVSQTLQVIAIMSNICFSRSINSIANNKCCRSPGYWARTCFQHLGTLFTLSPEVQLIFLLYFDVNPVICKGNKYYHNSLLISGSMRDKALTCLQPCGVLIKPKQFVRNILGH